MVTSVKKLMDSLWGGAPKRSRVAVAESESSFFSTQFAERQDDSGRFVKWADRAAHIKAQPYDAPAGSALLRKLWQRDRHAAQLCPESLQRLGGYFSYVQVPAAQAVIEQDEHGNYLFWVLDGELRVERQQPGGGRAPLAQAKPGDLLGEMSLLDAGARLSACITISPCVLAVLEADAFDRMMRDEPALAMTLLASLARRLSLRLRQVTTRLNALLAQA